MASALVELGDLDDALDLYQIALPIQQTALGEEHADVATTLNNIASVLRRQGNLEEALFEYEAALAIRRRVLGEGHEQ